MAKKEISVGLKAIAANNAARMGTNVTKFADFSNHGITSATDSVYGKGCIISIPSMEEIDEIDGLIGFDTFTSNGRTSKAPYVWCDSTEGNKKLYLSQPCRRVQKYKETAEGKFERDGEAVHAETEMFEDLKDIRDAGSLLEAMAGRDIEVLDHLTGKTAQYTSGVITGLRDFNAAVMEWAAEKPKKKK